MANSEQQTHTAMTHFHQKDNGNLTYPCKDTEACFKNSVLSPDHLVDYVHITLDDPDNLH